MSFSLHLVYEYLKNTAAEQSWLANFPRQTLATFNSSIGKDTIFVLRCMVGRTDVVLEGERVVDWCNLDHSWPRSRRFSCDRLAPKAVRQYRQVEFVTSKTPHRYQADHLKPAVVATVDFMHIVKRGSEPQNSGRVAGLSNRAKQHGNLQQSLKVQVKENGAAELKAELAEMIGGKCHLVVLYVYVIRRIGGDVLPNSRLWLSSTAIQKVDGWWIRILRQVWKQYGHVEFLWKRLTVGAQWDNWPKGVGFGWVWRPYGALFNRYDSRVVDWAWLECYTSMLRADFNVSLLWVGWCQGCAIVVSDRAGDRLVRPHCRPSCVMVSFRRAREGLRGLAWKQWGEIWGRFSFKVGKRKSNRKYDLFSKMKSILWVKASFELHEKSTEWDSRSGMARSTNNSKSYQRGRERERKKERQGRGERERERPEKGGRCRERERERERETERLRKSNRTGVIASKTFLSFTLVDSKPPTCT